MTIRLVAILTLLISDTFGQQEVATRDILEIVKVAVSDKKLPKQLINNIDSLYFARTKKQNETAVAHHYPLTIGIDGKNNGLKHHENIKWGNVEIWVWGEEEFFMWDIYWLTPSEIKIKGNKVSFDFSTHTWGDKNVKYYKGTIKAEKINGQWAVRSSRMIETKNNFDHWRRLKEGNKR